MKNNDHSLTAELISTFDQASQILADHGYIDDDGEHWWCEWRSRNFRDGVQLAETLIDGDAFVSEDARTIVRESLDWYDEFLKERGFEFMRLRLDGLISRVSKAEIGAPDSKNHPRGSTAALKGHETILPL